MQTIAFSWFKKACCILFTMFAFWKIDKNWFSEMRSCFDFLRDFPDFLFHCSLQRLTSTSEISVLLLWYCLFYIKTCFKLIRSFLSKLSGISFPQVPYKTLFWKFFQNSKRNTSDGFVFLVSPLLDSTYLKLCIES